MRRRSLSCNREPVAGIPRYVFPVGDVGGTRQQYVNMSARADGDIREALSQLRPIIADIRPPASFCPRQSRLGRLGRLSARDGQLNLLGASIIWIIDAGHQLIALQPVEDE